MSKAAYNQKFVDLVITEAKPSVKSRLTRNYRVCTVTACQKKKYINLRIPVNIQQKILEAYNQGKQVRIFA